MSRKAQQGATASVDASPSEIGVNATIETVKQALEIERIKGEQIDAIQAAELAKGNHPIKLAQVSETEEQRQKAHAASVDLIRREMDEQAAVNPPRVLTQGIDPASIEMIKEEMAKSRRRIELPSG